MLLFVYGFDRRQYSSLLGYLAEQIDLIFLIFAVLNDTYGSFSTISWVSQVRIDRDQIEWNDSFSMLSWARRYGTKKKSKSLLEFTAFYVFQNPWRS